MVSRLLFCIIFRNCGEGTPFMLYVCAKDADSVTVHDTDDGLEETMSIDAVLAANKKLACAGMPIYGVNEWSIDIIEGEDLINALRLTGVAHKPDEASVAKFGLLRPRPDTRISVYNYIRASLDIVLNDFIDRHGIKRGNTGYYFYFKRIALEEDIGEESNEGKLAFRFDLPMSDVFSVYLAVLETVYNSSGAMETLDERHLFGIVRPVVWKASDFIYDSLVGNEEASNALRYDSDRLISADVVDRVVNPLLLDVVDFFESRLQDIMFELKFAESDANPVRHIKDFKSVVDLKRLWGSYWRCHFFSGSHTPHFEQIYTTKSLLEELRNVGLLSKTYYLILCDKLYIWTRGG